MNFTKISFVSLILIVGAFVSATELHDKNIAPIKLLNIRAEVKKLNLDTASLIKLFHSDDFGIPMNIKDASNFYNLNCLDFPTEDNSKIQRIYLYEIKVQNGSVLGKIPARTGRYTSPQFSQIKAFVFTPTGLVGQQGGHRVEIRSNDEEDRYIILSTYAGEVSGALYCR